MVLCKTVVERAEVVPIVSANQDNKIIKITKGKEVRKPLQLRSIQQLKFDREERNIPDRAGEVRDKDIIAPEKFRVRIGHLLRANCNVATNSDRELGQT